LGVVVPLAEDRWRMEDRSARMRDDRKYPPCFPSRSALQICARNRHQPLESILIDIFTMQGKF
jgi:hypothetical protein